MNKIKEHWPLITVYLIALGYFEIIGYYAEFNLNINPYLNISDIFQIQFGLYILFAFIVGIIIWSIIIKHFYGKEMKRITDVKMIEEAIITSSKFFGIEYILFFPLLLLGLVPFIGEYGSKKIINGKATREVILTFEKTTVKTDKNNMYIGQTKDYVFFYNRLTKQSTVYKMADIKELKFSPGLDYSHQKL